MADGGLRIICPQADPHMGSFQIAGRNITHCKKVVIDFASKEHVPEATIILDMILPEVDVVAEWIVKEGQARLVRVVNPGKSADHTVVQDMETGKQIAGVSGVKLTLDTVYLNLAELTFCPTIMAPDYSLGHGRVHPRELGYDCTDLQGEWDWKASGQYA